MFCRLVLSCNDNNSRCRFLFSALGNVSGIVQATMNLICFNGKRRQGHAEKLVERTQ